MSLNYQIFELEQGVSFSRIQKSIIGKNSNTFDLFLWNRSIKQISLNNLKENVEIQYSFMKEFIFDSVLTDSFHFISCDSGFIKVIASDSKQECFSFTYQNTNIAKLALFCRQSMLEIVGIKLDGSGVIIFNTNDRDIMMKRQPKMQEYKFNVEFYSIDQDQNVILMLGKSLKFQVFRPNSDIQEIQFNELDMQLLGIDDISVIKGFDFQYNKESDTFKIYLLTKQQLTMFSFNHNQNKQTAIKEYQLDLFRQTSKKLTSNCIQQIFAEKSKNAYKNSEVICLYEKQIARFSLNQLSIKIVFDISGLQGMDQEKLQRYVFISGNKFNGNYHFCAISNSDNIEKQIVEKQKILILREQANR